MRTRLISGLVIGLMALGACSSDDDDGPTTQAGGETSGAAAPTGLDASFGNGGVLALPLSPDAHDRLLAAANGPDGSVYAAGWTSPGGDNAMLVAKIGSDGKLDSAFGQGGIASVNVAVGGKAVEVARSVAVQPDGKVVISGPVEKDPKATGAAAKDTDIAVVRFDATGKPDPAFGKGGTAIIDIGAGKAVGESYVADNSWGMAALAGGRLVVFGSSPAADRDDADYAILGLTSAGALDPAFGTKGITKVDVDQATDNARGVIVQSDGKLVFAGYSRDSGGVINPVLIRTGSDGKLDSGFGKDGVATDSIVVPGGVAEAYGVALQGDKYVLTGYGRGASAGREGRHDVDAVQRRRLLGQELRHRRPHPDRHRRGRRPRPERHGAARRAGPPRGQRLAAGRRRRRHGRAPRQGREVGLAVSAPTGGCCPTWAARATPGSG